jgi:nitroreductase
MAEQDEGSSRRGGATGGSVADAIARWVTCRGYKPDPVPEAHLLQILEAARLAPSACKQQPWRFAVVRNPDLRRRIVEEGFLPGINMTWAITAPVHVVVGMEMSFLTHRVEQRVCHSVISIWLRTAAADCSPDEDMTKTAS